VWKGKTTQNTNWNKICETPERPHLVLRGDHWGADARENADRYDRPWGFGNTTVCWYDPRTDKTGVELELDKASSLFSNAETPGHGKIHSNIQSDRRGNLYMAGYLGSSYDHEYTQAAFPKSYSGGALIRYNPAAKTTDYIGSPARTAPWSALYYDETRDVLKRPHGEPGDFWRVNLATRELERYENVGRMMRVVDRVREMKHGPDRCVLVQQRLRRAHPVRSDDKNLHRHRCDHPRKTHGLPGLRVLLEERALRISSDGFVWAYDTASGKLEDYAMSSASQRAALYAEQSPSTRTGAAVLHGREPRRAPFTNGRWRGGHHPRSQDAEILLDGSRRWSREAASARSPQRTRRLLQLLRARLDGGPNTRRRGRDITRPFLVRYDPPRDLSALNK